MIKHLILLNVGVIDEDTAYIFSPKALLLISYNRKLLYLLYWFPHIWSWFPFLVFSFSSTDNRHPSCQVKSTSSFKKFAHSRTHYEYIWPFFCITHNFSEFNIIWNMSELSQNVIKVDGWMDDVSFNLCWQNLNWN